MKLEQIQLPVHNKILSDYWEDESALQSFFNYRYEQRAFEERKEKLVKGTYNRQALSEVIRTYMEPFGISEKGHKHLAELEAGALAIVGGQQAGVLTGPLYSVHKAITVLKLAEEQRQKLGMPIVPIFWIAGEDHDVEEINHTYTIVDGQLKKRGYAKRSVAKTMASATAIDQAEMDRFIETVFQDFGETEHTQQLLARVKQANEQSATFTAFFTHLMNDLFAEYGLLMIDAAYEPFRNMESLYFERLIESNETITKAVVAQERALVEAGYPAPMEATINNANLFYVRDGERFLLERSGGDFVNAAARLRFTQADMLALAKNTPGQLSNNVVTRPLMQEMTIPVLAFVGGPGELAYWATLKPAFEALALDMPIFAPRLHMTLVTRQAERYLEKHELTVEQVIQGRVPDKLEAFMTQVRDQEALAQVDAMEAQLAAQYELLAQHLETGALHLEQTMQRNRAYHMQQFDYLKKKIEEQTKQKHHVAIAQFNTLQAELLPQGSYQERFYSPYQYMNMYGPSLIADLIALPLEVAQRKIIVKY